MDKIKTGNMIRDARTQKGYTQTELGTLLGVSNKAVSRWENGDSFPDIGVPQKEHCFSVQGQGQQVFISAKPDKRSLCDRNDVLSGK